MPKNRARCAERQTKSDHNRTDDLRERIRAEKGNDARRRDQEKKDRAGTHIYMTLQGPIKNVFTQDKFLMTTLELKASDERSSLNRFHCPVRYQTVDDTVHR